MKLNRYFIFFTASVALILCGGGCAGVSTGGGVSPASFFLPGLLRNDSPTNAPVLPEISKEIAKN